MKSSGFVKDEDAEDLDYDEMMEEIQSEEEATRKYGTGKRRIYRRCTSLARSSKALLR